MPLFLGISYLNINEEEKYNKYIEDMENSKANFQQKQQEDKDNRIQIPNEDKPFIDSIMFVS